jgi:hypothetical protein
MASTEKKSKLSSAAYTTSRVNSSGMQSVRHFAPSQEHRSARERAWPEKLSQQDDRKIGRKIIASVINILTGISR